MRKATLFVVVGLMGRCWRWPHVVAAAVVQASQPPAAARAMLLPVRRFSRRR